MAPAKDYYQVLGVAETAAQDEIKRAFRRLAKEHHPDRNPNNPKAAERFKEINEAHDVLSDPEKRKKYDQLRRYGAFSGAGGPWWEGSRGGGRRPAPQSEGESFDFDFSAFGGLGDLFSSIFGKKAPEEERPEAIELVVDIPFATAVQGGKVTVTVPRTEACPTCGGSGAAPGAKVSTCTECKGRGTVSFGQGTFTVNRPCPKCRGKGTVAAAPCETCRGAGDVRVEQRIALTVPPGTEDDTKLRVRGQGEGGRKGKAPGDLMVTFRVRPDRFFRREGLDLVCTIPINVIQAILGTKIRVRTLDGRRVMLKVPPGTQHGQRFRIPGVGVEKNGRTGDQLVEVDVRVPEKLTAEQEALLKQFAEKSGIRY
jgi:molecular chaperone DnaJ